MPDKISIDWRGRRVDIETAWVGSADAAAPVMVFLHEGLGSVAQWKNFPDTLCRHLGMRGLLYSRPGYGASTPRAPDEHWGVDFMHQQALEVLPAVLAHYGITAPWLYGHSDGGSIALLFAAHFPQVPAGIVVAAPHILVEEISVTSIAAARHAYLHQGLRARLARYHQDVDSAFFGWCDAWLSPAFRSWSIESVLDQIRCPLLAIQGEEDEYGSLQQVWGIRARAPQAEVQQFATCGHAPHISQPQQNIAAVAAFVAAHLTA
jgi:pimeloyl-ACP methyl ester carboxylesterase